MLGAYASIYDLGASLAELLLPPFNTTLPALLDGEHSSSALNRAIGTSLPTEVMDPAFVQALRANPDHPLRRALRENDVYDWTPRTPMRLFHCGADQDVIFANSQLAFDTFRERGATQVELINPSPTLGHGDCAIFALLGGKVFFDTFVQR
jgi:hypothetical protein